MPKYPLGIRILHWLMALIIIGLLCVGLYMTGMSKDDPLRGTLYMLHKSFGVIILVLFFVRLLWRLGAGVPALPDVIPAAERNAAHLGHYALYLFMIGMPLSGFIMSQAGSYPVVFFGITLPRLMEKNPPIGKLMDTIHDYGAYTLIALLCLHVAGVVFHRVKERVNLLQRMV